MKKLSLRPDLWLHVVADPANAEATIYDATVLAVHEDDSIDVRMYDADGTPMGDLARVEHYTVSADGAPYFQLVEEGTSEEEEAAEEGTDNGH